MRVLFDQGVPAPLRHHLPAHRVETAYERGWSDLRNGDLLQAAEAAGFEVFVTTDRSLRHQQNLSDRKLSVVVLLSTSWPRIRAAIDDVQAAIERALDSGYQEVPIPWSHRAGRVVAGGGITGTSGAGWVVAAAPMRASSIWPCRA